jgi:hypothetical protein
MCHRTWSLQQLLNLFLEDVKEEGPPVQRKAPMQMAPWLERLGLLAKDMHAQALDTGPPATDLKCLICHANLISLEFCAMPV